MKRALSTAVLLTLAAFSTGSLAQGRHDEKPHGSMKAAPSSTGSSPGAGTGGRHDEGSTSHGKKKKRAVKKSKSSTQDVAKDPTVK